MSNLVNIEKPIFIVGMCPRSGTTLLRRVLNYHSDIRFCPFESYFLQEIWSNRGIFPILSKLDKKNLPLKIKKYYNDRWKREDIFRGNNLIERLDKGDLRGQFEEINLLYNLSLEDWLNEFNKSDKNFSDFYMSLLKIFADFEGKTRIADKDPTLYRYVPKLVQMYPKCKIVNMVRDPRAVALSMFRKKAVGPTNLVDIATLVKNSITLKENYFRYLSKDNYYEISYEKLISDSESTLEKLCNFLEINLENQMLNPKNYGSSSYERKTSVGFDKSRLDLWRSKITPEQLGIIEYVLHQKLIDHKYDIITQDFTNISYINKLRIELTSISFTLEERINHISDKLGFGFLRVHTKKYRTFIQRFLKLNINSYIHAL